MNLPTKYREIILGGREPGEAYQKCMKALAAHGRRTDYGFTEAIVYATEVRYATEILAKGRPKRFWNFGDLEGGADERHYRILDRIEHLDIAFVGSGPYPVSAFLIKERYPTARITCIDNHIAAHILAEAVITRLGMDVATRLEDAIDVDYRPFNAVVVAAMVSGKRGLVEKILETSDAIVIVRGRTDLSHERLIQLGSTFRDDGSFGLNIP